MVLNKDGSPQALFAGYKCYLLQNVFCSRRWLPLTNVLLQIHELTEKFKSERDTTAKYKKSYSDLQQRYNSVEHAYSELTVKYKELNSSKTSLEKKLIGLQSALEEEKNTQSRNSDYIKELESR